MKLLIQIPCFNEANTLPFVLRDLPRSVSGFDAVEVVVVDDGSTDGTYNIAIREGADHVIRHRINRGLAAAFATGLEFSLLSHADVIVNTDGDHQYRGEYITSLVEPIIAGRADIVIGDRNPGADMRSSIWKRLLQRVGRRAVSYLAGEDIKDPVCGFRAISREAACKLQIVTRYSYTIESVIQAVHKGLAIEFVPIATNVPTRPSRLFRNIPHFVSRSAATLLRVFFMFHSLHVLIYLSLVLGFVGIIPILRFLVLYAMGSGSGHLQSLVLGGAALVLSCLAFISAMLADLIAHNRRLLEMTLEKLKANTNHAANALQHDGRAEPNANAKEECDQMV